MKQRPRPFQTFYACFARRRSSQLESQLSKSEDANLQLKSKINATSNQVDKIQHDYQNLSLIAASQKKEISKLSSSLNATQSELKEKTQDFNKMQREHEEEMDTLQNELFMESEVRMNKNRSSS